MADQIQKMTVTKLEAAQRQLRTAIRLWFNDGDPVSIHTLLAAAHEIIHRLYRNKGLSGLLFNSKRIKDEFRAEWARKIKEAPNFFKHATHEPAQATLEFRPGVNGTLPIFMIQALRDMGEPLGMEEMAYTRWKWVTEPELFHLESGCPPVHLVEHFKGVTKTEFFKVMETLAAKGELPDTFE